MKPYFDKLKEAEYNLNEAKRNLALGNNNFVHSLNNFLSSVQSIIWTLNKAFAHKEGYDGWQSGRGARLPAIGKVFKELRNISLKEQPIRNENLIVELDFGAKGIKIPPHARIEGPVFDTVKGVYISNMVTIIPKNGAPYEVEPLIIYDFSVKTESDGIEYRLDNFVSSANSYVAALRFEIEATEKKFK